jgi:7,8-dihydro-6-hydroxymethylpterin-pyrophosphokinase
LRQIEAALGRSRSMDKYAARTIDLDLLLYGDSVISSDELTIPDPDILTRAFIAFPLYEIAPTLVLPGFGVPIREIVERLATEPMKPMHEYTRQLQHDLVVSDKKF